MGGGIEGQLPKTGERKQRKGKKRRAWIKEGEHEPKAKRGKRVAKKKDNNHDVEEMKCAG